MKVFLILFFSIFAFAGLATSVFFSIPTFLEQWDARHWVETPCQIVSSEVKVNRGSDSTTYSPEIHFQYTFEGREYEAKGYRLVGGSSSGGWARRVVDRFPEGEETVCFVNPQDPSRAVLDPSWGWDILLVLIPLPFLVVGVGGLFWVIARKAKPFGQGAITPDPAWLRRYDQVAWAGTPQPKGQINLDAPGGMVPLKSESTPMAKFIGTILIALFWNGITSVFVVMAINSWREGDPDWFLTLFMIPFVLVGLGLIMGVFYFLLGLFNAKPKLWASDPEPHLGDVLRLRWKIEGRTDNMETLRISLEGREMATYRRGTKTYTSTETFADTEVARIDTRFEMFSGNAEFLIPAETIHSFSAYRNKIDWRIIVRGKIHWWPDVVRRYPIRIMPLRLETPQSSANFS